MTLASERVLSGASRVDGTTGLLIPEQVEPVTSHEKRPTERQRRRDGIGGYLLWLRFQDVCIVALTVAIADTWGRSSGWGFGTWGYATLVFCGVLIAWSAVLHALDTYDVRHAGHGVQEYRRVFQASVWLIALLALLSYASDIPVARGYVLVAFPLGTAALVAARWVARKWLVARRSSGSLTDAVLLVGDRRHVEALVVALARTPGAGYQVVGACVDGVPVGTTVAGVSVLGAESDVVIQALAQGVDVVAVSSSSGLGSHGLRKLGWSLEQTEIKLVVAPEIMDVAGPRLVTRPVQGLPLLHVEAPVFTGPRRLFKSLIDRGAATLGLLVLLPFFLSVAAIVRLSDPGPALFRQRRIGRGGRPFSMMKFRTMVADAEAQLPALREANEGAGPLFKLKADPRVTKAGAFLRRHSIDEVPQLLNVLRGDMSLVGPRPPLPSEVADYDPDTHRRLKVKPGMTGLWQISGRSDLSWEESVRLDLYYVENWTPWLDLMILWRTVKVVVRPGSHGAY